MTEYFILGIAAFGASVLTFFSGFGLGTILSPLFAVFFPIDIAIALTAIVHLLNNLFKLLLVGRHANKSILTRFGITSVIGAFLGALLLISLTKVPSITSYQLGSYLCTITPIKLIISLLMIFFALLEIIPRFANLSFGIDKLPLGGLISGFFGGLSGHQGALRSAFLLRCEMSKESFIATGVTIACFVDITRLAVYSEKYFDGSLLNHSGILVVSILAAFAGAYLGSHLLKKTTLVSVQKMVTVLILLLAIALGTGLI